MNSPVSSTTARTMLIAGPANDNDQPLPARLGQETARIVGVSRRPAARPPSSRSRRTESRKSGNRSRRCLKPNRRGPKPKLNVSTFTSKKRAAQKWPSSWIRIMTPIRTRYHQMFCKKSHITLCFYARNALLRLQLSRPSALRSRFAPLRASARSISSTSATDRGFRVGHPVQSLRHRRRNRRERNSPVQKASTAISSAAFSVQVAEPPASCAS